MQPAKPLILASTSPRRRQLLAAAGIPIACHAPKDADETPLPGEQPQDLVLRLAQLKAASLLPDFPDQIILGADTIVVLDGQILGKPADLAEAADYLRRLSGHTHQVITGVALLRAEPPLQRTWTSVCHVTFHQLTEDTIAHALTLTNPLDKAGGYAIQEQAQVLVDSHTGLLSNIIGLPVEEVIQDLLTHRP